jgi:basic membrane protein A
MRKYNIIFSIAFTLILLSNFGPSAMGSTVTETTLKAGEFQIAVVYSTGGLGDKSFNDAAYVGVQQALAEFGDNLTVVSTEPETVDEINNAIDAYAAEEKYDLIIAIGFSSAGGLNASALEYPNQQFMIIDMVVDLPNVNSVVFKEHEGSFLVGALAAMVTQTDDVAFLGGLDIPLINKFRTGFEQGARYINPNITLRAAYSPDASNPWGDVVGGKNVADSFIEEGSDIIFAAAGGTGLGVFDAAEEADASGKTVYAIGVDSNQDYLKPGYVLTSMIKRVDVAVYNDIAAIVNGSWSATFTSLGLAENGVGITDMTYTQALKDAIYETGTTNYEKVMEISVDIVNGTIVVDDELVETGVVVGIAEEEAPGFLFPMLAFGMIMVYFIRKRKV